MKPAYQEVSSAYAVMKPANAEVLSACSGMKLSHFQTPTSRFSAPTLRSQRLIFFTLSQPAIRLFVNSFGHEKEEHKMGSTIVPS